MQNDWAYAEFYHAPLWDARCRSTLVAACHQLAEQAQVAFSRALGSRRKRPRPLCCAGIAARLRCVVKGRLHRWY